MNIAPAVEPDPREIVLCLYEPTLDGFAAAWVVRKAFRENFIPVEFSQSKEGLTYGADGRNALCFGDLPIGHANGARSAIYFTTKQHALEKPIPFNQWEKVFPYGVKTFSRGVVAATAYQKRLVDSNVSLCRLAWDFFYPEEGVPLLLSKIGDHVSGLAGTDAADFYACADSYPQNFATFDALVEACEDPKKRDFMLAGGQSINRYLKKYGIHNGKI